MYIGLCGPSGAGKDTFAQLLADERGYAHVSGGDILREMLSSLGLEPKKSALGPFGVFIRDNYGLAPLFERVLAKAAGNNGVIITGIRSPDEARLIKQYGGTLIFIDADPDIRYERIVQRARGHDGLSRKDFDALERQEYGGATGTEQNLGAIKEMADLCITNDGTLDDLKGLLNLVK